MKDKEIIRFQKGRRMKKVIHIPNFLLKLKGKSDANRSITIVQSQLKAFLNKCSMLENHEVLQAEKLLHPYRDEGGVLIVKMDKLRDRIAAIPELISEVTPLDYRQNRRNENAKLTATTEMQLSFERLTQIYELIVDIDTCLEHRIEKMRYRCSSKLQAYISGAKSVDKDFDFEVAYVDKAFEKYKVKHSALDDAVEKAITSIYNKEVINHEVI